MICKTEGFILKTYDFREKSKIAIFYTKDFGKIKGLLKGIKEDKRNFFTHLELSSKNEIIFYPNKRSDLNLVSRCDLIQDFPSLRFDLKRMVISNCFLELIENITPLEEKNPSIYNLLEICLLALNNGFSPELLWIFFQIKLLKLTGFKPELKNCLSCQKEINNSAYFSLPKGGLLCLRCSQEEKNIKRLPKGIIASLLYLEKVDFKKFSSFRMNREMVKILRDLIKRFIEHHSEIKIKSERLLN